MSNYAILRCAKLKGSSHTASDRHNGRLRDTPNADPSRLHLNHVLLGEDRELHELVAERIRDEGIWQRKDSVLVVELLLTATRTHFTNERGEIDERKVAAWEQRNVEWLKAKYSTKVLKAVSHRDERTPHIAGYVLPEVAGRLNAKEFVGDRQGLRRLQDEYAEAMKELKLERGVRGSRATHQEIGRFYGTLLEPVRLEVEREQMRAPRALEMATQKGRDAYRDEVIKSTLKQVEEQVATIRRQSLLTLEETRKREAVERREAERVAEAERRTRQAEQGFLRERQQKEALERRNLDLKSALFLEQEKTKELEKRVERGETRLRDIPLAEVMEWRSYRIEQQADRTVYRTRAGEVALSVKGQEAYDSEGRMVCRSSVDLVRHVEQKERGQEVSAERAASWLAEQFGEKRATAAYVVWSEQGMIRLLEERRRERERQELLRTHPTLARLAEPPGQVRGRETNGNRSRGGRGR